MGCKFVCIRALLHPNYEILFLKIFINDIPVFLINTSKMEDGQQYDLIIDGTKQKIVPKKLLDDVLIINANPDKVEELLELMTEKKFKNVASITFTSDQKQEMMDYIKSKFKVVEAAGGVVEKDGKNLLIYRQNRWDIPKGKLDKNEKRRGCAIREVQEETGVKVEILYKIGHTWHTYIRNNRYVLKKTHWYAMSCLNDSKMKPQKKEGIEDVKWMTLTEVRASLYDSYRSIRAVMQEYHRKLKVRSEV